MAEVSTVQGSACEDSIAQIRTAKVSIAQIGLPEVTPPQVSTAKVGSPEVSCLYFCRRLAQTPQYKDNAADADRLNTSAQLCKEADSIDRLNTARTRLDPPVLNQNKGAIQPENR